jgi:hypothetical protein
MLHRRYTSSAAVSLIVFLSAGRIQAQQPQVWYFSSSEEKIDVPNVLRKGPKDLEQGWKGMLGQRAICAMDLAVFRSSASPSNLKNLIDNGNPVVVVGDRLEIGLIRWEGRVTKKPPSSDRPPAVVDGVYRDKNGQYNDFTVSSVSPISTSVKLKETQNELGALAFSPFPTGASPWKQRDGASQDLLDPGFGKIVQTMTPFILDPTPDGTDHWYAKLGISIKSQNGLIAKVHSVQVDSSQTSGLSCFGPRTPVSRQQDAIVSLDCPGPKVEWSWKTLDSEVLPNNNSSEAGWKTVFPASGVRGPMFWWCPGLSVRNPRGQPLELDVRNEIQWIDTSGKTTTHQLLWPKPFVSKP